MIALKKSHKKSPVLFIYYILIYSSTPYLNFEVP